MRINKFEWGPLARGIYIGMLWLTVIVGWNFPDILIYYIPLLLFLGLWLRPLMEISGLYDLYIDWSIKIEEKKWNNINERRRIEIRKKERDKKYRHSRYKDPNLPKNW